MDEFLREDGVFVIYRSGDIQEIGFTRKKLNIICADSGHTIKLIHIKEDNTKELYEVSITEFYQNGRAQNGELVLPLDKWKKVS